MSSSLKAQPYPFMSQVKDMRIKNNYAKPSNNGNAGERQYREYDAQIE